MSAKDAARVGDSTKHGPPLNGPGCSDVQIGGANAWRVGDFHSCSLATGPGAPIPHVGGAVLKGSMSVVMGGKPAARKDDIVNEPAAQPPPAECIPMNTITAGCSNVQIGDPAFGLMKKSNLEAFCREFRQLLADWNSPGMTPAERERRMAAVMNNAMQRAGLPPLNGVSEAFLNGQGGRFTPQNFDVLFESGNFGNTPSPELGRMAMHEMRHAEQWYNGGRAMAGAGASEQAIAREMRLNQGIAGEAFRNPAAPLSPEANLGTMTRESEYGRGLAGDGQQTQMQYTQGVRQGQGVAGEYGALPTEIDARAIEAELAAVCP